jgi:hypothetical protein
VAEFKQENLADNLQYLDFFHDPDAQPPLAVNIDAAEMMGKLHDILHKHDILLSREHHLRIDCIYQ